MAYSYTRQSSMSDGDTITAALFNNEYNQLVNAFAYSSSSAGSTGHRHDGTAGHGGNIHTIGDLDFLNKIAVSGNTWGFFVEVSSAAVEQVRLSDGVLAPVTDNDIDLGTSSLEFKDAYFDGTVTSDAFAGPLTGDVTGNVSGTAATVTTAAQSNITSLGTLTTLTVDNVIINGTTIGHTSDTDLMTLTSGVLTVAGEVDATTLDISGNADIDGTLEADAYTVDGTALNEYIADTVGAMVGSNTESGITVAYEDGDNTLDFTVGTLNQDTTGTADNITISANNSTDETVYPIFVDGATGSQGAESDTGLTYNPSTGMLTTSGVTATFTGNITGNVTGNTSGTAATVTTAAQSNITSLGTLTTLTVDNVIINGTTIGHTSDTDLITLADGNVTIAGELDLTTLDVSGNADIDGTLEADAYTVDGTALNEYIADTVGAMVGSNTETNITVTYEDGDNTLDFVIGTLNQDTTGTADNITISANNSTDETVYPIFVDGATGSQGAESDTGLTYNPSSGLLTSTLFAGTLNTAAQGNVTSLGTLTALTVDDVAVDGKVITMTGSASDTAVFTAGTNGTLSIVTTDAAAAAANIQITADGTVDIDSAGVLTLDSGAAINIEPASGSAILLDGTISIDAGVITGATAITLSGELDAGSLDVSGDADIDGTLEADAITVDGTTLAEYIADTVGAMVGSNTETGITVTYEDGDNTLDFVIGTLNQDTTGNAATFTASANNSTDETVYPVFVDGSTGSQGAETDTGFTYNPSSGLLTISGELDAGSLDISGNADIDGTLETDNLTVGGAQGSDGQVLTSTGSGVGWEDASSGGISTGKAIAMAIVFG